MIEGVLMRSFSSLQDILKFAETRDYDLAGIRCYKDYSAAPSTFPPNSHYF